MAAVRDASDHNIDDALCDVGEAPGSGSGSGDASAEPPAPAAPSAAMRARAERNRRRARALRAAAARPPAPAPDTGGGFLPEEGAAAAAGARAASPPPAPLLDPAERPACLECARPVALSYLLDTFHYPVCDECREAEGAHSLVTRTEARSEYLLQECDLDSRWGGALRCVRRRNPHAPRGADMRLYLRAQVEERALLVWGDEARLREELARREEARGRVRAGREARRLRALRMDVRSSLFRAPRPHHEHTFAPETYNPAGDVYSRSCACGHTETYEKM